MIKGQQTSLCGLASMLWVGGTQTGVQESFPGEPYMVALSGNEDMAKAMRKWKRGDPVVVEGTIGDLKIEASPDTSKKMGVFTVVLSGCQVTHRDE
jgi:hypothetical protein